MSAERIAALLLEARGGASLVDATAEAPADLAQVYRIQGLVLEALSGSARCSAWKAIPPRPGAEPTASPVPPACVLASPASLAAGRGLLGVEAEIAFRLGADLSADEAMVLIELAETRLASWEEAPALWKLADFQSNGALIVGSGTRAWREIDFAAQAVELWINGKLERRATGAHPSGDPSRLLPWLARHAAGRGGLQPGDVITTGSWVGIVKVHPGDDVVAGFPGIGEARLRLGRR